MGSKGATLASDHRLAGLKDSERGGASMGPEVLAGLGDWREGAGREEKADREREA